MRPACLRALRRGFAQIEEEYDRLGTPAEIADMVAFLASDDGRWITGHWIDATGGSPA